MSKYRKRIPEVMKAITFQELVEYGIQNGGNMVEGMPWSFDYEGLKITHENDEHYRVSYPGAGWHLEMTPEWVLCIDERRNYFIYNAEQFSKDYEKEGGQKLSLLQRLEIEETELGSKIFALSRALGEDGFYDKVGKQQFDLMCVQQSTMLGYRKVLIMRIEDIRSQSKTSITSEVGSGDENQKSPSEKA